MSSLMNIVSWLDKHDKRRYLAMSVIILVVLAGIYLIVTGVAGLVLKVIALFAS